jgi:hypothetical protein
MKLTTDLSLVSAVMNGAISPLLYTPLWREQGTLSFYLYDELMTRLFKVLKHTHYAVMFLKVRPVIKQCPQYSQNTDLSLAGGYVESAVK